MRPRSPAHKEGGVSLGSVGLLSILGFCSPELRKGSHSYKLSCSSQGSETNGLESNLDLVEVAGPVGF